MPDPTTDETVRRFEHALLLTTRNMILDAAAEFREIVERWPDHDLADDALYNLGSCWLALGQYGRAAETFREILRRYPDAQIHDSDNAGEQGRTGAKALLGLLAANLGRGDVEQARVAADMLSEYTDSFIARPGVTRTYYEIGQSLLQAATDEQAPDTADHVAQEDVIEGGDGE
jgi:tetratricopeptide (TPR) repeat protein